jgi:hyaluronan synthase
MWGLKIMLGILFPISIVTMFVGNIFFQWNDLYIGLLILIYFSTQVTFAILNKEVYKKIAHDEDFTYPLISFNIVGYREDPSYWKNCLESLRDLNYPKNKISGIFAFIDGCEEEDKYMKDIFEDVFIEDGNEYMTECLLLTHGGKRNVMYNGFKHIRQLFPDNKYILVIDSDTIIHPDAVTHLVKAVEWNHFNGCGTGSLKIFNNSKLLTKIVHSRYGYAFDIERGAMSYVGCMNCCSGPFSIYKQKLLDDELLENFLNQKYCGRQVGPGDDRHLTNLILEKGYRSIQTPYAIAYTESPEIFKRFLLQQLRWMRSFYREILWQLRAIPHQHPYLIVITTYESLFPFFILLSIISPFYDKWPLGLLIRRVYYSMGILAFRTFLLLCFKNWDINYIFNICYFPLYFLFLLPIKIYALLTCYQMGWITSDRKKIVLYSSIENTLLVIIVVTWWCLLSLSVLSFFFDFNSLLHQFLHLF